jgi:hypothetical protein
LPLCGSGLASATEKQSGRRGVGHTLTPDIHVALTRGLVT